MSCDFIGYMKFYYVSYALSNALINPYANIISESYRLFLCLLGYIFFIFILRNRKGK